MTELQLNKKMRKMAMDILDVRFSDWAKAFETAEEWEITEDEILHIWETWANEGSEKPELNACVIYCIQNKLQRELEEKLSSEHAETVLSTLTLVFNGLDSGIYVLASEYEKFFNAITAETPNSPFSEPVYTWIIEQLHPSDLVYFRGN